MTKQFRRFSMAALLCQVLLPAHLAGQDWTHWVRIGGYGLSLDRADRIIENAKETHVFGIETDNDIPGRYESFLDPTEKLKAIRAVANEVKAPVSLSVDVEVEVPSPISLEVHMTGGDLTVEGVEGDKNLQLFAGDLKVDVGTLQNVRDAEVSVRVGDVSVPAIGEVHGWLGHTWTYQGNGQYRLYAHTGFGDVSLVTK